ncbi:MAG: branched-chain amino acid ABC transporter permease [Deltaproteobacteria bacterium]
MTPDPMNLFRNIAKAVLPVLLLSVPVLFLSDREFLNPYWVQIFQLACVVAISALGLNLIYGFTGLFSLGHAAFYGVGAYTAAALTKLSIGAYGDEAALATGAVFLGSLVAGGAAAGALAFLVGLPVLRLTSDYLGIATLGFGVIMKVLFDNADAFLPVLGGARGMTGISRLTSVPWAAAGLVAAVLVIRNLVHSSYGRALVAVREDETAASAMGIDVHRYKVIGFTAGCVFAGVAGGLYAHLYTFLHPSTFDFLKSFDVLMIVVLGGLGNMTGTLVASFGWVFLLEGLRIALPPEYIEFRWVVIPLLLIVTMLVRPQGLFGLREFPLLRSKVYR